MATKMCSCGGGLPMMEKAAFAGMAVGHCFYKMYGKIYYVLVHLIACFAREIKFVPTFLYVCL